VGNEQMSWAAFKLASIAFAIPIPVIGFLGDQQGKLLAITPTAVATVAGMLVLAILGISYTVYMIFSKE
jgi:putative effector of murein hydrolase